MGVRALSVAVFCAAVLVAPAAAHAAATTSLVSSTPLPGGAERVEYKYGPLEAAPGHNLILIGPVTVEKPPGEGFVTRIDPGVIRPDGSVPPVEQVHMHHAVMLNMSRRDATDPSLPGERFYAFAEEKTIGQMPPGFGYPVQQNDVWAINYMLHNETSNQEELFVTYTIDFVPSDAPAAQGMRAARPVWLDVQNGKAYPVFDVHRWSGGQKGHITYPDEVKPFPYGAGKRLNEWKVDRDSVLLMTAGHVHPGGLWTNLYVDRGTQSRMVFRSDANYFDPGGPISWDMAMTATPPDWMVQVHKGDVLRVTATYETELASWYESMGIMLVYMADGDFGHDPFQQQVKTTGEVTHGHLAATNNHGGAATGLPDPAKSPNGQTIDNGIAIAGFKYLPGDMTGPIANPPVVQPTQQLRFGNFDASAQIFHTITACQDPCTASTGVSYPLANGEVDFDSGQLGYGPGGFTAAAQRSDWYTPKDLPAGTYTYFCRVHPFMRGSFRVMGAAQPRVLEVPARRARVDRAGRVHLNAACGGRRSGACRGTVELRDKGTLLGAASFVIPAGQARSVVVPLSPRGRALLRRSRSLSASLVAQADDSAEVRHPIILRRR